MKNLMRGITTKPVTSTASANSDIFINVFGELPSKTSLIDFKHSTFEQLVDQRRHKLIRLHKHHSLSSCSQISELRTWLDEKLTNLEDRSTGGSQDDTDIIPSFRDGFIGSETVVFDVLDDDQSLGVNVSNDGLLIQSQSPFPTVKANCCVYRGKWMYEVQLRSKGIMQIGWCSAKCKFTDDTGIGDTPNSYGLDGSKQRLWNVRTRK